MRALAIAIAGLCVGVPFAAAESAEQARTRGEQLAKEGRYTEAIESFKQAERLEPRARHACLIALAYTRRELWPQAEIFLEACEKRATAADPVPDWLPAAKQQLAERLASANVAAVELRVVPAAPDVKLEVSSFAPDEQFAPRTIHLPLGKHVVTAKAMGYRDTEQTIDVVDKTPLQITIELRPPFAAATPSSPSKVWVVIGLGGALALGGGIVHLTIVRGAREDMLDANARGIAAGTDTTASQLASADFDAAADRFSKWRAVTIALYATGAVAIGIGVVLKIKYGPEAPSVAVVPTAGGGMLALEWR